MGSQSYDELIWHLKRLRHAAVDGKLYFLLGAGVSAAYGLADWRSLLLELMQATGRLRLRGLDDLKKRVGDLLGAIIVDPLLQAEAARNAYGDAEHWHDALRRRLTGTHVDVTSSEGAIDEIARLIAYQHHAHPKRHVAVLTFNYDDLLERALALKLGTAENIHVVATDRSWAGVSVDDAGVFVYHLHGALSDPGSELILDAGSYVELLKAPASHWSWQCMHRFLLSQPHAGVILLGLSLVDPSIRLLLSSAVAGQHSLFGLFITNPFPSINASHGRDTSFDRAMAYAARDMQTLLDETLETLSLVPYHVSEWSEVHEILRRVTP